MIVNSSTQLSLQAIPIYDFILYMIAVDFVIHCLHVSNAQLPARLFIFCEQMVDVF